MIEKVDYSMFAIDKSFSGICKIPYHGHSKGCINYGKKEGCPPGLSSLEEVFDISKPIYVIHTSYPIGEFAEKMRQMHPEWKEEVYYYNNKFSIPVNNLKERLKIKHPEWKGNYFPSDSEEIGRSSREWYNPRRWQGVARKEHRHEVENFLRKNEMVLEGELKEALKIFYNPSSRKKSALIKNGMLDIGKIRINKSPEAHGLNVTALMAELGYELNWLWPPPHKLSNKSYVISLAGIQKK